MTPEDEYRVRKFLWLNYGCSIHCLYGDDGELQCSNMKRHGIIDFKRDSITHILDTLTNEITYTKRRKKHEGKI